MFSLFHALVQVLCMEEIGDSRVNKQRGINSLNVGFKRKGIYEITLYGEIQSG